MPPTYVDTARPYGTGSGIRLYAVPEDWHGVGVLPGGDVELLQRHHRFLAAPCSLHHSGAVYRLYGPNGTETPDGTLPPRSGLPSLGQAWLQSLYRKPRKRGAPATTLDVRQFADTYTFDEYPYMLAKTVRDVREATGAKGTRPAYHKALWIAARNARAGCYPWLRARDAIEAAAVAAYAERGLELDPFEFGRSIEHAITCVLDMPASTLTDWGGENLPPTTGSGRRGYRPAYRRAYQPAYRPNWRR